MRQLGFFSVLGLWAALCFGGGLYASWQGYGGYKFAATLTVFSFYFGVMLLLAARGVPEFLSGCFGLRAGYALAACAFLAYLIYGASTNTFEFARAGAIAAMIGVPLALATSANGKPLGAWQDYVTIAGIWVTVKFSPSYWLWPYPKGRLAYVFTVLLCVNVALAAFVLVRKLPGIGYNIG